MSNAYKIEFDKKTKNKMVNRDLEVYDKDSYMATRRVSKNVLYCELGKQVEEYSLTPLSLIITAVGVFYLIYLMVKYTNQTLYSNDLNTFIVQCLMVIVFIVAGFSLHNIFVNRKLKIEYSIGKIVEYLGLGLGLSSIGIIFQTILKSMFFSVSSFDYFMFFVAVAIGEEYLFRFGLLPTIKIIFNFNQKLASFVAIILTSLTFTLYHVFVYESNIDLIIVFVVGCLFGFALEFRKSFDTPLIMHVVLNIIAGINLVNTVFGGFYF